MGELKNYREVGNFDVLNAPLNPIGAFNAEQFKTDFSELLETGSRHIVVDLGNLDFLYSDAFNAFMSVQTQVAQKKGSLGILTSNQDIINSLNRAGVNQGATIYPNESAIMEASLTKKKVVVEPASSPESPIPTPTRAFSPNDENSGGRRHKFTQSFNSTLAQNEIEDIDLDSDSSGSFGMQNEEEIGGSSLAWLWALLFILAIGGAAAAAYYFLVLGG